MGEKYKQIQIYPWKNLQREVKQFLVLGVHQPNFSHEQVWHVELVCCLDYFSSNWKKTSTSGKYLMLTSLKALTYKEYLAYLISFLDASNKK